MLFFFGGVSKKELLLTLLLGYHGTVLYTCCGIVAVYNCISKYNTMQCMFIINCISRNVENVGPDSVPFWEKSSPCLDVKSSEEGYAFVFCEVK